METLESAQARGATIFAEIAGFGMTSDAGHITKPSQLGAEEAMRLALKDAGMEPSEIDYINAHGTGTTANDSMESAAIKTVFGDHTPNIGVSSTKSMRLTKASGRFVCPANGNALNTRFGSGQ